MARRTADFHVAPRQMDSEIVDLAYLDLTADGEILAKDGMAERFLRLNPQYVAGSETERFSIAPAAAFARSLQAACDETQPVSSVFAPQEEDGSPFLQINVLPFRPGVARVVLFWSQTDAGRMCMPDPKLSVRERAVLKLAAAGLRRDRIAYKLNISLPTVDMHCRNLRRKLSAQTTSEAVAIAVTMNLLAS